MSSSGFGSSIRSEAVGAAELARRLRHRINPLSRRSPQLVL
jgi:hypothetical protein